MKIKQFQQGLKKKKIDFAVFYNLDSMNYDKDISYFSGYKGIGILIIPKNKKPFLIVPEMEYGRAKNKIKVYKWAKKKRLFEFASYVINKNKIKKKNIGINKNVFTLNVHKAFKKNFKKIKVVDISELCEKIREIKTDEEIKKIKKACSITDKLFSQLINNLKNKKIKTEIDISNFLETEAKKYNCELAFKPIVASGKGSSIPHYEAQNIKLRKGFLVLDLGVKYQDYNSDITRTVYIGKPTKKETQMYGFLLKIQKNTIKEIKINEKCSKIYDNVKKELKNYSKNFTHGLGHGIGIKVHELPNLTENTKDRIQKNMVFTIEPGIYFENRFGIRIEDTVLMKNKAIRLTKTTKDLLTV
ncbi:aminopeptidase P family protein [Candidatus Woesearchaeota archaeon]|nr:aminopeptidase P family protein [Candidatus Woesearchaeota archaeon]